MFLLTLRDLQYRAVRFAIAIVGTSLVFAMVLLMAGLSAQFRREPQTTVEAVGGQTWIIPEGVTGAFTSGATMPAELSDELVDAGASRADPVVVVRHTASSGDETRDILVFGHVLGGLGTPDAVDGRQADAEGQVVASEESDLAVGDTTMIGGREFSVVGTTTDRTIFGGTPLVFMPLTDAQELVFQGQPVATAIVVEGDVAAPEGTSARSVEETWRDALRPLEKPVGAIDVVQILLWLVAATIIGAVVYLSALERRRDFAVMKAVGASSRGLLAGLAAQSIVVALLAALVATGIQAALVPVFPIPVNVPASAYVQLPILALLAGALASLSGLRKAVNVDPALAFSGPGG